MTSVEDSKQAIAIYMSLEGTARQTARSELTTTDLKVAAGVNKLFEVLDKEYETDKAEDAYSSFDNFIKYRRPSGMNVDDYLTDFNIKYNEMKGHGITLDDKVLAYFVLNCANLSDESTAICRGTCPELSYANMRKQIKKIAAPEKPRSKADTIISDEFFVENVPEETSPDMNSEEFQIWYEENNGSFDTNEPQQQQQTQDDESHGHDVLFSTGSSRPPSFANRYNNRRPGSGGRGASNYTPNRQFSVNPPDNSGKPSTCGICNSIFHWAGKCPHKQGNQSQHRGRGAGRGFSSWRGYHRRNAGNGSGNYQGNF